MNTITNFFQKYKKLKILFVVFYFSRDETNDLWLEQHKAFGWYYIDDEQDAEMDTLGIKASNMFSPGNSLFA